MSFWDDLRNEVKERITTGDVSNDLFDTILSTGVNGVAVIQPTFYLGRFYTLCCDYMDFIEKFLAGPAEPDEVLRHILYLRETVSTMGRCIRNAAEPLDGMMNFLDPIYDKEYLADYNGEDEEGDCACGCAEGECECEHEHGHEECDDHEEDDDEDLDDEFQTECTALREELQSKLSGAGVSERVALELAERLAQTYSGCVTYVRELRCLHKTEPAVDISAIMVALIDLQYIMDTKLRRLLLEDVFMAERPAFTTGLVPWISHAVEELARQL